MELSHARKARLDLGRVLPFQPEGPMSHCDHVAQHYERCWSARGEPQDWHRGPRDELPEGFDVLRFAPRAKRPIWTYATVCMSQPDDPALLELHLHSPVETEDHVELLTVIAHYHRTGKPLGLGHTVNFGRPWRPESECSFGLISLPYLDGPELEELKTEGLLVRCLWLIPITKSEVEFKKSNGLEALEERFEAAGFDYLDPIRPSVV